MLFEVSLHKVETKQNEEKHQKNYSQQLHANLAPGRA